MADALNTILTAAVVQDGYTPDLTLGPIAGVVDGIDLQVERADVLFQVARGSDSASLAWLESREYQMRPGSRFVGNVAGIRFRNATPGAAAVVTAAILGADEPRLGPVIPLPATGIGDPLVQLTELPAGGGPATFGPFDVGDWPSLLLGAYAGDVGQGVRLSAEYDLIATGYGGGFSAERALHVLNSNAYIGGGQPSGLLVCENLLSQVSINVVWLGGVAAHGGVFVAPCAFTKQQLVDTVETPGILLATDATLCGAGVSQKWLLPPYKGVGSLEFIATNAGGPWRVQLDPVDYGNVSPSNANLYSNAGALFAGALAQPPIEVPLVPMPMVLTVTNTGGAGANYRATLTVKEPS